MYKIVSVSSGIVGVNRLIRRTFVQASQIQEVKTRLNPINLRDKSPHFSYRLHDMFQHLLTQESFWDGSIHKIIFPITQFVNQELSFTGTPPCRFEIGAEFGSEIHEFNRKDWKVSIANFQPEQISGMDSNDRKLFLSYLFVTCFHEAFHAEQNYQILRLLQSSTSTSSWTPDLIHEVTDCPKSVVSQAKDHPLGLSCTKTKSDLIIEWYQWLYGEHQQVRVQLLDKLFSSHAGMTASDKDRAILETVNRIADERDALLLESEIISSLHR